MLKLGTAACQVDVPCNIGALRVDPDSRRVDPDLSGLTLTPSSRSPNRNLIIGFQGTMSAVGFEPTRSYLQWILSPPP